MSLSVQVSSGWPEDTAVSVTEDLRLCLDRSSDSDSSQTELNQSLTELIESITVPGDDEDVCGPGQVPSAASAGREVVADIVQRILSRVEETAGAAVRPTGELTGARQIDCETSRDPETHRRPDSPRKAERRKRDRSDHERKKARRRSTSCSTTSSACSTLSRRHRRKHKHHRRKEDEREVEVEVKSEVKDPCPRVNPIFLWVKQDDTRIVEVLCEDYDKRNRIRLTKTAQGWRATPRTERLDSTLSRSSLDQTPTLEDLPLVTPCETKEKKPKRSVSKRRRRKRCDKKKDKGFKRANTYVNSEHVDAVNNNSSISNNNNVDKTLATEPSISEPRLRSFGYKKACHVGPRVVGKKKDNKKLADIDVYDFVSTPKSEQGSEPEFGSEAELCHDTDLNVKSEPEESMEESQCEEESPCDTEVCHSVVKREPEEVVKLEENQNEPVKPEEKEQEDVNMEVESSKGSTCEDNAEEEEEEDEEEPSQAPVSENTSVLDSPKLTKPQTSSPDHQECIKELRVELTKIDQEPASIKEVVKLVNNEVQEKPIQEDHQTEADTITTTSDIEPIPETVSEKEIKVEILKIPQPILSISSASNVKSDPVPVAEQELPASSSVEKEVKEPPPEITSNTDVDKFENTLKEIKVDTIVETQKPKDDTSPSENVEFDEKSLEDDIEEDLEDDIEEEIEEEEEEESVPEVILPEPHLQTPEPSPQPVPEPSSTEPEISITTLSLQPETSLDSDTIHLPDTTTKSDTALLINNDLSLGEKLSIKTDSEISMGPSSLLTPGSIINESKSHQPQQHVDDLKTAEMLREAEIDRQISADLDEDHLLAIEEILQGEECVEDFDDDDLPDEYSGPHESPVNLVIDLKSKDQVDNIGIPLSLRTDDFLEIFPSPLSMKEHSDILPTLPTKGSQDKVEKPIPPAHQQSKTKFLESMLSFNKKARKEESKKVDASDQQEPLYLGVSRKSASPTVSSSDGRKFSSPDLEPKPKRMKVDDITLKTILNRNKETTAKTKVHKPKDTDETQQTADSTTKSRLLELLTNENEEHISKLDPLTQLKEILSDPELTVPDPLLVPRSRLPALVANPAKEIPRLIALKSESLSYPKLLTDPDLLVVSLSHLQSLLQATGKEEEMMKYQQQAQLLQQQMKQDQNPPLDAATATALNQMMWLPYLSQLEAATMTCGGNSQDFMTMLNMLFPSGSYPQMNPYMMTPTSPSINAYDYKSQLEFQQAFALWNEAMMQAATNQFAAQSLNASSATSNNNISKLYQSYQDTKFNPKSHSNSSSKMQEPKHAAARTSPITPNYQQGKYRSSQYPYTSMFSIPTSTPATTTSSSSSANASLYRTTQSTPQTQQNSYNSRARDFNYSTYSTLRTPTHSSTSLPKTDHTSSAITSDLYKTHHKPTQNSSHSSSSNNNCKSLMNILSKPLPKQTEVKTSSYPGSKVFPTSTTMLPKETTIRLTQPPPVTTRTPQEPPKLKVKQPQHLVDPNSKPKLFNFDEHGEVGSTTGSLTPQVDDTHPNLWHPLFSSHQQKSYSSPWQWTTPVTVSGE